MVKVKSFKGYTCKPELAEELMCLPYDVLETSEAKILSKGHEHSFYRVAKPDIDLPAEINQYDKQVYEQGKKNLNEFVEKGFIQQESNPIMYVYAQHMTVEQSGVEPYKHWQYGIMLLASVEEYEKDIIKKHELTRIKKEQDRIDLIENQNANAEPVFLAYNDNEEISKIQQQVVARESMFHIKLDDGFEHRAWKCTQEESDQLVELFKGVDKLYIADGHHRTAAAAKIGYKKRQIAQQQGTFTGDEDFMYMMALVYPKSHLYIMEYNRLIKNTNGLNDNQILDQLEQFFTVRKLDPEEPRLPQKRYDFNFYIGKQWYCMTIKQELIELSHPVNKLGIDLLTKYCITPLFGITDLRSDDRIDFVGGIRGTKELEERCEKDAKLAISCFPITFDEVQDVAEAGLQMPPKATWFEPKPRSGAIVRILQE